jgi:type II secretory pathway pseudopilin PulG
VGASLLRGLKPRERFALRGRIIAPHVKTSAQLAQSLLAVASGGRSHPSLSFGSQPPITRITQIVFSRTDNRPVAPKRCEGGQPITANRVNRRRAFTVIELLVVTGILVILMVLVIPALVALSAGNGLSTGGRVVSNLLTIARSEAINRHTSIRFEVATTWPADSSQAFRKITLVQHDNVANTDTQLTGWQTLPAGIAIKDGTAAPPTGKYFLSLNQTQSLTLAGQTISAKYLEFSPTGAPNVDPASAPVRVRVVAGYVAGASITQVFSSDWYELDVDGLIGKTQVNRP